MFNKPPTNTPSRPAMTDLGATIPSTPSPAPARTGPRVASLISEGLQFEGGVTGDGELHVDGMVRGDIRVRQLTLSETGVIEGAVIAELVEVRGKVLGSISGKQVRLYVTAHVEGDITHEQLAIEAGAFFQGRSLRLQRPPQKGEPAAKAPEEPKALEAPKA